MVSGRAIAVAALALAGAWAAAGCTEFEDPAIVLDLRVLGMRAEPPEIMLPYDPDDPTAIDLAAVGPIEVCALVADPGEERGLEYSMSYCRPTTSGRCHDYEDTVVDLGGGPIGDPEGPEPVSPCATLSPSPELAQVVMESFAADNFLGFGGVRVQVDLEVRPEGGGRDEVVHAFKRVLYSPQLPAERVANANPTVNRFIGLRTPTGERGLDFDVPLGRCGEIEPFVVAPGERVALLPDEPPEAREEYVVPTFDGDSRHFTENLTYQWHATLGDWSPFESGGTVDVAGNEPTLDSTWRGPVGRDLIGEGLDVRIWIVQRDERGGQTWYESCARAVP
jgi:hypothetical protein